MNEHNTALFHINIFQLENNVPGRLVALKLHCEVFYVLIAENTLILMMKIHCEIFYVLIAEIKRQMNKTNPPSSIECRSIFQAVSLVGLTYIFQKPPY